MPFSQSAQISTILGFVESLGPPQSILDVGTGMGQYGFLLRTNLENVGLFEIDGKTARQASRDRWKFVIDGIEGFPAYLTPVHEYAYNQMMIGDAMELLSPDIGRIDKQSYDLVLAVDILEHFDMPTGRCFLGLCQRVARRCVLVSTPKDFVEQDVEANPLENHRSCWTAEQLAASGFNHVLPNAQSWIAAWHRPTPPIPI